MPIYLGGPHRKNLNICLIFEPFQESTTVTDTLCCEHEGADKRHFYHINHAIEVEKYDRVTVASPDTDVFLCLVHHFSRWINQIWKLCGQDHSKRYIAIHDIVKSIPQELSDVLPAVYSSTGCDTTSNVLAKYTAIKNATKDYYHPLAKFGKSDLNVT